MNLRVASLLAFCALTGAATAQDATCVSTPDHLIAIAPDPEVGDNFAIYHKDSPDQEPACVFDREKADIVLTGWYALEGVEDNYLVASEGSSAVRTLLHFELNKGKVLLSADAELGELTPAGLSYWERREDATPENCPQYEEYRGYGGSGVISHKLTYDFATKEIAASGETRCDYLE